MRTGRVGSRPKPPEVTQVEAVTGPSKAIVVFHDQGSERHPLSRFLRKGFRHCFVAMQTGDYWVRVDGTQGVPEIEVLASVSFDLAGMYRGLGLTVVETEQRATPIRTPYVLANCVGLVKTALCIRSWAVTPHQLYRHLTKEQP